MHLTKQFLRNHYTNLVDYKAICLCFYDIKSVDQNAFSGLKNLQGIDLSYNSLSCVDSFFESLNSLEIIRLPYNQITWINPLSFQSLHNLKSLNLNWNKIYQIDENTFKGLKALKEIFICSNHLSIIYPKTFTGLCSLERLILQSNQICSIHSTTLMGLKNLKEIDLSFNQISSIAAFTFNELESLEIICLSYNKLTSLNSTVFRGLKKLNWIRLDSNQINKIDSDTFKDLESLKWINLDSNKLTTFDPFIFQGLAKLEKIHLNHNLIDRINPVAFENNNLNGIFLVANRLTFIDPSFFVSLKKLSEFKIDENRFSSKSLADIQKQFPTKVKITHENQTSINESSETPTPNDDSSSERSSSSDVLNKTVVLNKLSGTLNLSSPVVDQPTSFKATDDDFNPVKQMERILIEEMDYDTGFRSNEMKHVTNLFKNGQYETIKKLGSGAFGTVFLVIDKLDNNTKKCIKSIPGYDDSTEMIREAKILKDHPNSFIIEYYDYFTEGINTFIVTEYCDGGDLEHLIDHSRKTNKVIDESKILKWAFEIMKGLTYLHEKKVIHRDIKPGNVFLKNESTKIGDLGLARSVNSTQLYVKSFVGTVYYTSPEIILRKEYTLNTDVWSAACVLYELLTLKKPFDGNSLLDIIKAITEDEPPKLTTLFGSILDLMFEKDPSKRPNSFHIMGKIEKLNKAILD